VEAVHIGLSPYLKLLVSLFIVAMKGAYHGLSQCRDKKATELVVRLARRNLCQQKLVGLALSAFH
jgi:hypothetical protein